MYLLQSKRTANDLLCERFTAFIVLPVYLDTVVNLEPGHMSPLHKLTDEIIVDLPLLFQHLQRRGTKQFLQRFEADIGHDVEVATWHKKAVDHQQVKMCMPATVVAKRLDGGHRAELARLDIEDCPEEMEQTSVGVLAEPGEQRTIVAEIDTQNFRQGESILAVL